MGSSQQPAVSFQQSAVGVFLEVEGVTGFPCGGCRLGTEWGYDYANRRLAEREVRKRSLGSMSRWSKSWGFLKHLSRKRWFVVLLVIFSMAVVLAGYNSAFRRALVFECEDPGRGIAFEVRGNWAIEYYERNGTYLLNIRRPIRMWDPRTIVIWTYPAFTEAFEPDKTPIDLEEIMGRELEKWRDFHESYALIQPPRIVERGDHQIAKATGAQIVYLEIEKKDKA